MGWYKLNEDGTYTLCFGKDRSVGSGFGPINVPVGAYTAKVLEDKELKAEARQAGPEGASAGQTRVVTCEIVAPEEIEGQAVAGEKVPVYMTVPDGMPDGTDKRVHWQWFEYIQALGINTLDLGDDDSLTLDPANATGTLVALEVFDNTWKDRRTGEVKTQRRARITGPAALEGEAEQAQPEAENEQAQPEPEPEPEPAKRPVATRPAVAPAKPAATKPAPAAATTRPAATRPAATTRPSAPVQPPKGRPTARR